MITRLSVMRAASNLRALSLLFIFGMAHEATRLATPARRASTTCNTWPRVLGVRLLCAQLWVLASCATPRCRRMHGLARRVALCHHLCRHAFCGKNSIPGPKSGMLVCPSQRVSALGSVELKRSPIVRVRIGRLVRLAAEQRFAQHSALFSR